MVRLVVQDSWGFFGIDKCWSSLASFLRNRIYVAAITLNLTEMLLRWMETPNGLLKSKEDFSELLTFIRLNHQYHSGGKIELSGMAKEYTQFHNKASWISTAIWITTERLFHKQSTCSNGLLQTGVYSHLPVEKSTRSTQPQSQKNRLIYHLIPCSLNSSLTNWDVNQNSITRSLHYLPIISHQGNLSTLPHSQI